MYKLDNVKIKSFERNRKQQINEKEHEGSVTEKFSLLKYNLFTSTCLNSTKSQSKSQHFSYSYLQTDFNFTWKDRDPSMSTLNNKNKCQKSGIALQYMTFQKSLLIRQSLLV